jgi:hypothetical protein
VAFERVAKFSVYLHQPPSLNGVLAFQRVRKKVKIVFIFLINQTKVEADET